MELTFVEMIVHIRQIHLALRTDEASVGVRALFTVGQRRRRATEQISGSQSPRVVIVHQVVDHGLQRDPRPSKLKELALEDVQVADGCHLGADQTLGLQERNLDKKIKNKGIQAMGTHWACGCSASPHLSTKGFRDANQIVCH